MAYGPQQSLGPIMIVQHVAGPYDVETGLQHCSRCGVILKDNRESSHEERLKRAWPWPAGPAYPVGAEVDRGPTWQAMVLGQGRGQPCMRGDDGHDSRTEADAVGDSEKEPR